MTKRHFIALANAVKHHDQTYGVFGVQELNTLANFCQSQNPNFKRQRWLDYIAGKCGANGGKIK